MDVQDSHIHCTGIQLMAICAWVQNDFNLHQSFDVVELLCYLVLESVKACLTPQSRLLGLGDNFDISREIVS